MEEWTEHQGSWRTTTPKYTIEVWEHDGSYRWAVYNYTGEYIFAGAGRTLAIAQRDSLSISR